MPKAKEVCEIIVNGKRYRNWTSVNVRRQFDALMTLFELAVVEKISDPLAWDKLQLRPSDEVTVYLAGSQICTGFIYQRQPAFNAVQHGVQLLGGSKLGDIVHSSADVKKGQFKKATCPTSAPVRQIGAI